MGVAGFSSPPGAPYAPTPTLSFPGAPRSSLISFPDPPAHNLDVAQLSTR